MVKGEDLRVEEGKEEEEEGCYTNNSFIMEHSRRVARWFSQPDLTEGPEKGSCGTLSTAGELRKRSSTVRRLVDKGGHIRVTHVGAPNQGHYVRDIYTTAVDIRWRYTFLLFTAAFFLSWLAFACIWHLSFIAQGIKVELNTKNETVPAKDSITDCVSEIKGFTSTFLFSVETQHTIGYGTRGSTSECWHTVILQCIQSIVGVIIQASMAGIVFAKLSRPKARAATIMFSKHAVISSRNGLLRLMCRVANMRSSQLLESHFTGVLVGEVTTMEGEVIRYHQTIIQLSVEIDDEGDDPKDYGHLLLPVVVSHTITPDSPLYRLGPTDLLYSKLELVVTLEGVVEPSGNTAQVRTSYLPDEILWGHHFRNCVNYIKQEGVYAVDLSKVDSVRADSTPRLSGALLSQAKMPAQKSQQADTSQGSAALALEGGGQNIRMIDEE